MISYAEYSGLNANIITEKDKKGDTHNYCNNIFVLDTEVTSLYHFSDGWDTFRPEVSADEYSDIEKGSILYIWQLGIDDTTYYGRELADLKIFLEKFCTDIQNQGLNKIIIYVHNLGYEFQFLRNILAFKSVFARKPRKPIYAISEICGVDIEFRCSLFLTNMPLEKVSENFALPVKKKVGDLDYNFLRTPHTPLSEKEMGYCENDIAVVRELIKQFISQYKIIEKIPLTSTGRIRRVVRRKMFKSANKIREWTPTPEIFMALQAAFAGGYTHANSVRVGHIYSNVKSYDFTSSYPAQMLLQKYPMGHFILDNINYFDEMRQTRAYVMEITLYNVMCNNYWEYISSSKCTELINPIIDNGRVVSADKLTITITDVDIQVITKNYSYDTYSINKCYSTIKDYLPKPFTDYIIELYHNKTKLKDVAGKEDLYRQSKSFLNGLYGMTVTNTICEQVNFDNQTDWTVAPLSLEDITEGLNDLHKKAFLYYAWGVWVTAYARAALWDAIFEIDYDAIYCDTDSIKYIGDYDNFFTEYNNSVVKKFEEVAAVRGYDKGTFAPCAPDGKPRPLGIFDYEGVYEGFITLGAKKYAYEKNGKCAVTVSGLSKKAPIKDLSEFVKGKIWGTDTSGRTVATYISDMPDITVIDTNGDIYTSHQRYGINLMPTTYKLGIAPTFEDFISAAQNIAHTKIAGI